MTSENMEQLGNLGMFIVKTLNIRRKWLTRVIEFLINLHMNLFALYKCYDSSIIVYSSLLFLLLCNLVWFLCYLLNFIDDITQYGIVIWIWVYTNYHYIACLSMRFLTYPRIINIYFCPCKRWYGPWLWCWGMSKIIILCYLITTRGK